MNAVVPFRLADEPFDALADPQEMGAFMRNSLPGQIDGLKQVLLLACMDKAKVIAFLEGRGAEDGTGAMTDLFEQVQETSEWIAGVAQIASSVMTFGTSIRSGIGRNRRRFGSGDFGS